MTLGDGLRDQLAGNSQGIFYDLLFAVVWVTFISALFEFVFVTGPTWAYYMFMLSGIPAYFGFFWSLEVAKAQAEE